MSNYEKIYSKVKLKLQDQQPPLENGKIQEIVVQTKSLYENDVEKILSSFWDLKENEAVTEDDWTRMARELEMHFDVRMENGYLIQGDEQQKRDTSWWTEKEKAENRLFYWNRYKEHIGNDFSPEVIRTIDIDTDVVMNNILNPDLPRFTSYGMVVGHVQSGKTANYSALIAKACDSGYKFIIVIAGGINNLRNQTQVRINEGIIGFEDGEPVGVGRLGGSKNENIPSSPTTATQDFNKRDADKLMGMFNFDNISVPVIMVIKKQTNTLTNVINWLKAKYKNKIANHAMLMIDDESDYASINTRDEEDPTAINKKLRQLMGLFEKSAYVAYTATPYANIFIDYKAESENYGLDLFPKDFIVALNAPDNYFGAYKIFLNDYKKYIRHIEDNELILPIKHKKDTVIEGLPESLKEAVRVFILNIAIRNLRGQKGKHNSMLIHVSRFTNVHVKISYYVEEYLNQLINEIVSFGSMNNATMYSEDIKTIKETFIVEKHVENYEWPTVLNEITEFIKSIKVREVHQKTKIPLEYNRNYGMNVIAVGGASLSRGYTLEGLSVSYFLRTTKMYDTLMQMGRWFGYRIGYEDICRIYMTKQMGTNFADIIEATEELFDDFRRMAEAKKTPNDFGLSVTQHPDSVLQVTANNKLRHTTDYYFSMNLDGSEKETTCIKKDDVLMKNNLQTIESLVQNLLNDESLKCSGDKLLWKDVERNKVIEFLNDFEVYAINPVYYNSKMPIEFIRQYALEIDTKWDIMLATGKKVNEKHTIGNCKFSKEFRTMTDKGNYIEANQRHISTGSLERVLFSKEEIIGKSRKDLRAIMKKPLLLLHIIDIKTDNDEEYKSVPAFGISFPGDVISATKIIRHKINKVYVDQLIEEMKEEE